MAEFPPGVSLATLSVGDSLDFFGNPASLDVQVTPILGGTTTHLVHAATGSTLVAFTRSFTTTGTALTFDAPHVDQPGWVNGDGEPVTMWSYRVLVTATIPGSPAVQWIKDVSPVIGQDVVDLDLVPNGDATKATVGDIPLVLSVNGQTGHVTVTGGEGGGSSTYSLSIGSVTTGAAGSPATASITGTGDAQQLNLGLPRGADGTAVALTMGTVTTLSSGAQATASVTGTYPDLKLNLGIPRGADGLNGTGGEGGGGGGAMPFTVAAADAPTAIRNAVAAGGGYVCDGTADQVQINAALTAYKYVQLTEGNFYLSGTVTMPRGRTLEGSGPDATRLLAASGLTGRIIYSTADWINVRHLGLGGNGINANGIEVAADSDTGFATGADACVVLDDIVMRYIQGDGVVMTGAYNRDSKLSKVHVWDGTGRGFYFNCPDGTGHQLISGTCGSHGLHLGPNSSNWRISNSKMWFADGDGFWIQGVRHRIEGCEGQDNEWAGLRINGSLLSVNGFTADSNSWNAGNSRANEHAGVEIGRAYNGSAWSNSGGYDITMTNVQSWDKNESSRGRAQAYGIRVRSGARGIWLSGFNTGDPLSSHFNVSGGVKWDTPSDQTHVSNYCSGLDHYRAIIPGGSVVTAPAPEASTVAAGGGLVMLENLAPIAPRAMISGGEYSHTTSATSQDKRTSRLYYRVVDHAVYARFLFQNLSLVRGLQTGPITVTASVERPENIVGTQVMTAVRVRFSGADSVTIPAGGTVLSDPVLIDAVAGSGVWVRTCTGAAVGSTWPNNTYSRNAVVAGEMVWWGDQTGTTSLTSGSTARTLSHGPAAILTQPTAKATVGVMGDSVSQGSGDEAADDGYWTRYAVANNVRLIRATTNGELARYALDTTNHRDKAWEMLDGLDYVVSALGVNDCSQWQSESGIKGQLPRVWARMGAASRRAVYQTTLTPYTQSSDGWTTVAGQTLRTFEPIRVNINAWLRAGAYIDGLGYAGDLNHPLAGVLDVAPAVEDTSGAWKPNMTADGVHPTPAGAEALATRLATVAPAAFTA